MAGGRRFWPRAASHAHAACVVTSLVACGGPRVEVRAIWVDAAGEDQRRIHVFDRGERRTLIVEGQTDAREHVRLSPRGRGVLVRAGDRKGAWFDLDDGRRLPLKLPRAMIHETQVELGATDDVLWWIDPDTRALDLVPLAPGLALEREGGDGPLVPLRAEGQWRWLRSAADAPVLLARPSSTFGATLLRYPSSADEAPVLGRVADFADAELPLSAWGEVHYCLTTLSCGVEIALDPSGSRVVYRSPGTQSWRSLEQRRPGLVTELELPPTLAEVGYLRLLALVEDTVSVWTGPGRLFRWDHELDEVEALPMFAEDLFWTSAERGHALVMMSSAGPSFRVDRRGIDILTLETTDCVRAGAPVVAPDGRWVAWTCSDLQAPNEATSGVIVRVSPAGLERHVGITMSALAIDDGGELLLDSEAVSATTPLDGLAPGRPRNLFVLSSGGVVSRVDELDPAPDPVEIGSSAVFLQAAALE